MELFCARALVCMPNMCGFCFEIFYTPFEFSYTYWLYVVLIVLPSCHFTFPLLTFLDINLSFLTLNKYLLLKKEHKISQIILALVHNLAFLFYVHSYQWHTWCDDIWGLFTPKMAGSKIILNLGDSKVHTKNYIDIGKQYCWINFRRIFYSWWTIKHWQTSFEFIGLAH